MMKKPSKQQSKQTLHDRRRELAPTELEKVIGGSGVVHEDTWSRNPR
jgi:hypothetical protein